MSQENVAKARDFISAYNRRDFDAAVASFDPEIEWVLPARQSADSCQGPEEIKRFWRGLDETFDELRLDPQEFIDGGDRVATRLRYYALGKGSGMELEMPLYHQVATFHDGKDGADRVLRRVGRGPGSCGARQLGRALTPSAPP